MQPAAIEGYRLSPQQRHLWLLQQGQSGCPYRVQYLVEVSGHLDTLALEGAFLRAASENEILHTYFCNVPEMVYPVQVVRETAGIAFQTDDLSDLSEPEQSERVEQIYNDYAELNIETGPVLSVSLLRLSPTRHVLLMTLAALCGDSKTLASLLREVARLYRRDDQHLGIPAEKIQYVVISEWQNELLESQETQAGRDYWTTRSFTDLHSHNGSGIETPDDLSFRPRSLPFTISAEPAGKLKTLADHAGIHIDSLLLACWEVVLWKMTECEQLLVGVAFDGRTDPELEHSLGLLTKFLPLSSAIDHDLPLVELGARLDQSANELKEWQEYFSWDLLKASDSQAGGYIRFLFESQPEALEEEAAGVRMKVIRRWACTQRYKLKLGCEVGQQVGLELSYDEAQVSATEAEMIAQRYIQVVEQAASRREVTVGEIEVVSEAEKRLLVEEWNETTRDIDQDRTVQDQIAAMAATYPEQIAVEAGEQQLSYQQLNERANRLAHYLRSKGVGPEVAVGVMLDRSLELVVALVAILKAGGAYLPLDPDYPQQRLRFMLADSQARLVITDSSHDSSLVDTANAEVIVIDQDSEQINAHSDQEITSRVSGDNLAYIIYTSGSTGVPKGVMIPHRSLYNHMLWMLEEFVFSIEDRVLQKTPYSFDASVWEIFAPLMSGARLVMARSGGHQDVEYLIQEIKARQITVLQVVPSLLKALLDGAGIEECQSLQRVFSGGEVLTSEVKEEFARQVGVELVNLYGPTEATIEATYWRCNGAERKRSEPIGKPISNARVYVLGERMEAVGIGMRGELYIGGESVGRGYVGRAEQTAERFVPDPYSRKGGERLYRTGDEVRYRGDGVLEYEGRRDGQVKVRGYRIELAEIEAALEQHPDVRQAVVVVSENNSGDRRLVGHVIARNDRAAKNGELISFLRPRLPVYMLPSTVIVVDQLPLLPNGKVDRDALAATRLVDNESNGHAIAPRTLIEESLAGIWAQILGTDRNLTLQDNFFELGGHSLLATRLISRVREVFEVDFPLGQLFDSPTVATMAEGIETLLRAGSKTLLPPIERVARDGELLLSFAQQRLWFMHQLDPDTTFYNLLTAVRIGGKLDRDALARSINEIVHRHEVLRTTFTQVNGTPYQIIIPRQEIEVTDIDLSRYPEREREAEAHRIAAEDSKQIFDLAQGPLLRATLIKLGEEDHVFIITLHHIVFDNWSTGILIRELCAFYESFSSNVPVDLPELPIQYADFAAWQRAHLQGELLEQQLSYWRERLSGPLSVLKLPTDYARPLNPSFRNLKQSVLLSDELSSSLRALANQEGVTLFITMLAAFYCLLYRYTGQQDLVLGSPIINRSRPEAEGLIGFFLNHLVLRVDLSGNPSFRQLLERVRTITLGAYTHQDVPFENLVEEIQPERNFNHMPLFNVLFALQNAPSAELKIPGLKLSGFRSGQDMIVLDLLMILIETKQGLVASLSGPKDLYEAETIREMLSHYKAVLEEVAARPDVNLLSITLPSERPGDFPDATALLNDRFEIQQFNF